MSELVFRTHTACMEALRHPELSAARFQGWSSQGANALERAYAFWVSRWSSPIRLLIRGSVGW